jgi:hypothetical protein
METIFVCKASSCLCIELPRKIDAQPRLFNDQMNILISHLSDDEDTRQIRLSIQNRYEQLMSTVDNKIQAILLEHQSNISSFEIINSDNSFLFSYSKSNGIRTWYYPN